MASADDPKFQCDNCGGTYDWDNAFEVSKKVGSSSGMFSGSSMGWISGPSYTSLGGSLSQTHYSLVKVCPTCYRIWLAREEARRGKQARLVIETVLLVFIPFFGGAFLQSLNGAIALFVVVISSIVIGRVLIPMK